MGATPRWTNDDELDVRFYVDAPALAAGQRSNLGPQLEALRLGLSQVETPLADPEAAMVARFENATRAGRVHRVLNAIGRDGEVLVAAFSGDALPRTVRVRFGDVLGPVVLLLRHAGELGDADDAGAAQAAEVRLDEAKAAYAAAKAAAS